MPWLLVAIYYFYQYALRSAPSVMMPQLAQAFGVTALGVASIVVLLLMVLTWVLFGVPGFFRGPVIGIVMGIASGAAMIPYTVIKEANPPELGGSATGVINFINFTFSALLGPVFGSLLVRVSEGSTTMSLEHYQAGFKPLLYGVVAALVLTCFLKETGKASTRTQDTRQARKEPQEAVGV